MPAPQSASKIKITDEIRPAAELKADPKNARRHSERQIAQIAASIENFGYVNKIAVRPDGQIIGGHATLDALKRLAHDPVEVRVVSGLSEAGYRKLGLALNKLPENSSWDPAILNEVLGELHQAGEDLEGVGFSDKELARAIAGEDPIDVKQIETGDVADEFWISVRGPIKKQAGVLKALQDVMKAFPEITVELGTISVE